MDEGLQGRAEDCLPKVADWTAIGRRIVRAAAMATAAAVMEGQVLAGDGPVLTEAGRQKT